ncbi:MAG: hypothetical protein LAP87_17935 [Acidobacteriia bacterium]|nr:hypothetical protein [Terriglobia bacterium]
MSGSGEPAGRFRHFLRELGPGALLSAAAISFAIYLSQKPAGQRISAAVADEISRGLGVYSQGPLVLVRLDRDFSKADLQTLLARAIPALMDNYQAAALGVDIDFSRGAYDQLAAQFSQWSKSRPEQAQRIIWAVGYERGAGHAGVPSEEVQPCTDCAGASCTHRFRPRRVFAEFEPVNSGLAYAWTDASGINRSSFRYGCHQDTTARLETFHFKLVETYCKEHPEDGNCGKLKPYNQGVTRLFSWYEAPIYDLCSLVSCAGGDLGAPPENRSLDLSHKIPILYSGMEGNDEHATIFGTRKGAEILASLTMNELLYGESNHVLLEAMKWALEIALAAILIVLFHWPLTEHWAILLSGPLFAGYLLLAPKLSTWFPDFRDYVLAVALGFTIEVWLKAVWQGGAEAWKNRKARKLAAQAMLTSTGGSNRAG